MKRLLPILFFTLLTTLQLPAQSRPATGYNAPGPIARVYPNPATTFVKFDLQKNADKISSVQIYSFLGKKMEEVVNLRPTTTVDLSGYDRGVYIYQIFDKRGKMIESGKFNVSR